MPGNTPILNLPYPIPDDTVDVPRDVKALADAIDPLGTVPVGAMMMWPGAVAPGGWLLCQGQANLSAATYPGLAALLGQTGGFVNMPDYRDVFPVGAGASMPLGSTGGAPSVALTVAQMPSHNHNGLTGARDRSQSHAHTIADQWMLANQPGAVFQAGAGSTPATITVQAADPADHLHSIASQGGSGAHENRPPYRSINFIIRAG